MIQSPGFTVFHDVCDSFQTCGRSQEPVISSGSRKASSPLGVLPTNALTSATLSPVHWTASTSTGFLRNLRAVIRAPRCRCRPGRSRLPRARPAPAPRARRSPRHPPPAGSRARPSVALLASELLVELAVLLDLRPPTIRGRRGVRAGLQRQQRTPPVVRLPPHMIGVEEPGSG